MCEYFIERFLQSDSKLQFFLLLKSNFDLTTWISPVCYRLIDNEPIQITVLEINTLRPLVVENEKREIITILTAYGFVVSKQ